MNPKKHAAEFVTYYKLIEQVKASLDALDAPVSEQSPDDTIIWDDIRTSFKFRGKARRFISAVEALYTSVEDFHRDIFPMDYPEFIENIPTVWHGDPREIHRHLEEARENLRNKAEAYRSNPTPENKATWQKAIEIEKQWTDLKWNAFTQSEGGDGTQDTEI